MYRLISDRYIIRSLYIGRFHENQTVLKPKEKLQINLYRYFRIVKYRYFRIVNGYNELYTEKKKGITCYETESSKRVADHSRGINALH